MISLTSDFDSDSFTSDISKTTSKRTETMIENSNQVDQLKKVIDLQGEKLNQMTNNNRELINVQSQLARLRSELEKSEMLRQTLEYELTILRAQHGKQTAFTHQLQIQYQQANEQINELQAKFKFIENEKQNQILEKDQRIKQLENEAETLHERERRIEILNEQIQKMEKTFSDSESISRKNLAQSILAKERQVEFQKEFELIQMKLEFSEQALEQEKTISNEAKLNIQLLNNRLNDLEIHNESLKKQNLNQERKLDEFERQLSNEKLLRSTISKLQSDLEEKCSETQKLIIDYEKQMKINREELANFRRKYRNNEDKYSLIITKIFDLLRLTRIINENHSNNDQSSLPTSKQMEEFKIYIEQMKTTKIELTNEINRLKKSFERLNKSHLTQKQIEQETELNKEKLEIELDQCRLNLNQFQENFKDLEKENEKLRKNLQMKSQIIENNQRKLKEFLRILCKTSSLNLSSIQSNEEKDWILLEKQIQFLLSKCQNLEEKLIERDRGTLQLTQKLEEQVLHLKEDFDQKHHLSILHKDQQIEKYLQEIQILNQQIQKFEIRLHQNQQKFIEDNQMKKNFCENQSKSNIIIRCLISILIPMKQRFIQSIEINRFLSQQTNRYQQIQNLLFKNIKFKGKSRFRCLIISLIALKRISFYSRQSQSQLKVLSNHFIYDQYLFDQFHNETILQTISIEKPFPSLIHFLNCLHSQLIYQGTLFKFIFNRFNKSTTTNQYFEQIQRLIIRLEQTENLLKEKEFESIQSREELMKVEKEIQNRIDYFQFERICDELQRALNREKQAQDLLNEQNNQLKSLTDILHQTQQEKDSFQNQIQQHLQIQKLSEDKIQQYQKSHQQMEENIKRAEKAIRFVVNDKEQISLFSQRINSALNHLDKLNLENLFQLIIQLDALIQLPTTTTTSSINHQLNDEKQLSTEFILTQTMAKNFLRLINRLKDQIDFDHKDIQSLKEHCQILTEQYRQITIEDRSISQSRQDQTIIQPIRLQINHQSSAFKPIKPEYSDR